MPVADGDYRKRLGDKRRGLAKAKREKAFSSAPPLKEPMKPYLGLPGTDKFPWQTNSIVEAIGSGLVGIGGVGLSKLLSDPKRDIAMANRDRLESDGFAMGADDPMNRVLMEAAIPGGGVGGSTRRVFGDLLEEAAARVPKSAGVKAPSMSGEYLSKAAQEGFISPEFLSDMRHTGVPLWDRVRNVAEKADIMDVPVVRDVADAPKRGRAIIGKGPDAVIREGKNNVNLIGSLLGSRFPGSEKASIKGVDLKTLTENIIESARTGERFFGDISESLHPMRPDFYQRVESGFIKPLAEKTGLSEDVLSQAGASYSPRKVVPMEMAQTIELAKRIGGKNVFKGLDVKKLTKGMSEMGLSQLLQEHTANFLNLADNPRHLGLTPENVVKTGVYSLNKARPLQETISEASDLPAWTFDTWMRRAAGFSDEALPEKAAYSRVLESVDAAMPDLIPIAERALIKAGYPKAEAKKLAKVPNVAQSIIWHDARNSLGDVLGRFM
jgi:hypothetical protein